MTPLQDALAQIFADVVAITEIEVVSLQQGLGRILAEDIHAAADVPPWDNSAMDGFAVHSADLAEVPATLRITQRIAAGEVGSTLAAGCAARIFTGAPVPDGADAVIMQEDTRWQEQRLECLESVACGANIRPRGQDVAMGQCVLECGRRLQPQDLGLLASVGISELKVLRHLRVGVFSTGDELQEPGQALGEGQIYNSNRYTLMGLLKVLDADFRDYGIAADTPEHTEELLRRAADDCDVLITTGGVSVGEEDHVKAVVEKLGQLQLWKLAIKPGKPLAYGRVCNVPFFGLPGNPAAAFVTFGLVVKGYLTAMQGGEQEGLATISAVADFDWPKPGRRQEYLRGTLQRAADGTLTASVFSNQSSGVLSVISHADCLVVMPVDATCSRGDRVEVITMKELVF